MPAITDLTFSQLSDALGTTGAVYVAEDPLGNITVQLSISAINDEQINSTANFGVVKFLTRLREACHKAQEAVNQPQAVGEKLDAFPAATSTGAVVDGYVQQIGSVKSKIAVATATQIVGPTV